MTWRAFGTDASLPFEDLTLDSVIEGSKAEVPLLTVKDVGIYAPLVCDLVVLHQLGDLGFEGFRVE